MKVNPKCRYCGNKVAEFGDICDNCGGEKNPLMDMVNDQNAIIKERMYGNETPDSFNEDYC
jgi:methionyl-tRNA synthetase